MAKDDVDNKRRRRLVKCMMLGRKVPPDDVEFASTSTANTARRALTVTMSAVAMLGLGLTQIHSLFPLTVATSLMLAFCALCLAGGVFFTFVNMRVWAWHRQHPADKAQEAAADLPDNFWDES